MREMGLHGLQAQPLSTASPLGEALNAVAAAAWVAWSMSAAASARHRSERCWPGAAWPLISGAAGTGRSPDAAQFRHALSPAPTLIPAAAASPGPGPRQRERPVDP